MHNLKLKKKCKNVESQQKTRYPYKKECIFSLLFFSKKVPQEIDLRTRAFLYCIARKRLSQTNETIDGNSVLGESEAPVARSTRACWKN